MGGWPGSPAHIPCERIFHTRCSQRGSSFLVPKYLIGLLRTGKLFCSEARLATDYAGFINAVPRPMPTILVAEDDAPVRALIHRILSREGFDVLCPPNRRIAVELAAAHPGAIDLLVADLSAPGFDDSEVLEQFDILSFEPAVLFISTAGERPPRPGSCITKPFRPSELVRKVRRLLERVGPKERASRRLTRVPSPAESGTAA